jgi:uracil-DNA glycosylase
VNPPIVLVGEALGADEHRLGTSFVGPSGVELLRQLDDAKIIQFTSEDNANLRKYYSNHDNAAVDMIWNLHSDEVRRTNVLNLHPHGNKLENLCGSKAEGIPGMPLILPGKYLNARYEPELDRLADELVELNPNLIICLGNTALWALTGQRGVSKIRGTTLTSTCCVTGFKLLPTYHPAAVLRQWELRPTTVMDLIKAKRESAYAEIRRPNCEIWIEPSLEDIATFFDNYVRGCDLLSVDIETSGDRITCIGFAPSASLALVIPFDDSRAKGGCYWATKELEAKCWGLIRRVLEEPTIPKLFQNGIYDIGFLMRSYGILTQGAKEDTMLLSHARQPESLKGLGYLGSIFTDHGSWKAMRKEADTLKRDA